MKKLFAILLAASMAASLSVSAFAATALTESPANNQSAGDYTIGVGGKYQAGTAAAEQICVDVTWEGMNFTYTEGDKEYNTGTHQTTTAPGTWSTNKPGITVTNHSNVDINAGLSFTAIGGGDGVTGTFYKRTDNPAATSDEDEPYIYTAITEEADQKFTLRSAAGKTRNDDDPSLDQSPKGTLCFGVSGGKINENKRLGSITVKIEKLASEVIDGWTVVYTEKGLRNAIDAGGNIKLGANIIGVTSTIMVNGSENQTLNIVLDLNGYTLSGSSSGMMFDIDGSGDNGAVISFTVKDSSTGEAGKIEGNPAVYVGKASFTLESGTLSNVTLAEAANMTVKGGTITNNQGKTCIHDNNGKATLTISGGSISSVENTAIYMNEGSMLTITGGSVSHTGSAHYAVYANGAAVEIKDGTINGNLGTHGSTGSITVTGGTFSKDPTTYLAEGYTATANAEGKYVVSKNSSSEGGTTETWTTVTDAASLKSALTAGGKVKLGANIDLTETLTIEVRDADLDITLDLNGYSIIDATMLTGNLLNFSNETENALKCVIQDSSDAGTTGKIEIGSDKTNASAIRVYGGDEADSTEIVVESGTISGYYALNLGGCAKATINGGMLTGNGENTESTALYFNGSDVSAVINGGTFRVESGESTIRVTQSGNKLEIKGGEIDGAIGVAADITPTITITGGTFSFDPSAYVDTNNYTVTANDGSSYTVSAKTSD